MTRALATAWAKDNIQVNAVLPGWIDTDLTRKGRAEVEGLHERVLARTPAGRWGTPEDHAGIAVFLASAASDFITGTAIRSAAASRCRAEMAQAPLSGVRACVFDAYGTLFDFASAGEELRGRCSATRRRRGRRYGATSSCNIAG